MFEIKVNLHFLILGIILFFILLNMVLKFLDGKIIEYLDKLSNHRELNELEIEYLNIKEKTRKSDFILSTFVKTIVFIQGFLMLIIILNNSKPV